MDKYDLLIKYMVKDQGSWQQCHSCHNYGSLSVDMNVKNCGDYIFVWHLIWEQLPKQMSSSASTSYSNIMSIIAQWFHIYQAQQTFQGSIVHFHTRLIENTSALSPELVLLHKHWIGVLIPPVSVIIRQEKLETVAIYIQNLREAGGKSMYERRKWRNGLNLIVSRLTKWILDW